MNQGNLVRQAFTVEPSFPIFRFFSGSLAVLGLELLLSLPLGGLLTQICNGGVAWIFSGILAGVLVFLACRSLYHLPIKPNPAARKIGQALVGMTIGFAIAHSDLAKLAADLPIFGVLTLFLLLSGIVIGYFYSRISQTNLLTALLATVPGGVGIMSSFAAEYGRDVALVSLVQVIRVTTVILLIPLVARASVGVASQGAASATLSPSLPTPLPDTLLNLHPLHLGCLALALLLTGLATHLASRWKIPAAPFVAGLVVGSIFNTILASILTSIVFMPAIDFNPPGLVRLLGQILLGITIGEYWGNKPIVDRRSIAYALVSVSLTLTAGLMASVFAMSLTGWDWLTCLLVTAPGGAPEMILVALSLDHHVELVTAGHVVRLIAINSSLPFWVLLFRTLDRQLANSEPVLHGTTPAKNFIER